MDILEKGEKELRRYRMREFYQLTHILFTKPERLILYKLLKDYRRRRDVDRLVHGLKLVLRTYTKLELLKYVRYFIWEGHLAEFDRMTNFHTLFRPRRKDRSLHHSLGNHFFVNLSKEVFTIDLFYPCIKYIELKLLAFSIKT